MFIIKEANYNDEIDIMDRFFKVSKELAKNNRLLAFNAHDKSLIWPQYKLFTKKKNVSKTGKPHQCYNNFFMISKDIGRKNIPSRVGANVQMRIFITFRYVV